MTGSRSRDRQSAPRRNVDDAAPRGLLISITGGRDLTLFEVDEAATRIREEVDQDANIILGATFDESLEGIIRVSVVATGIETEVANAARPSEEQRAQPRPTPAVQSRPAPSQSTAPAAAATAPVAAATASAATPKAEPAPAPAAAVETGSPEVAEVIREAEREMESFERQAAADLARSTGSEATFQPQSRLFQQPMTARPSTQPVSADTVREPARPQEAQRLPRVEDFPPMVQAEIESREPHATSEGEDDRGPIGLLKRLTHGLSRSEEKAASSAPQTAQPRAEMRPAEPRRTLSQDAQLYAPRKGTLDDQGRASPAAAGEDDQLEIPAFLRRQAN